MNREQTLEAIKVMQHFADGGEVEYCQRSRIDWNCAGTPVWDWDTTKYRIKPKPLEWWDVLDRDGDWVARFSKKEEAELEAAERNYWGPYTVKHMVEAP